MTHPFWGYTYSCLGIWLAEEPQLQKECTNPDGGALLPRESTVKVFACIVPVSTTSSVTRWGSPILSAPAVIPVASPDSDPRFMVPKRQGFVALSRGFVEENRCQDWRELNLVQVD